MVLPLPLSPATVVMEDSSSSIESETSSTATVTEPPPNIPSLPKVLVTWSNSRNALMTSPLLRTDGKPLLYGLQG